MSAVFDGNPDEQLIKRHMDSIAAKTNEVPGERLYEKWGSILIALKKGEGNGRVTELDILRCADATGLGAAVGTAVEFGDMAAICVTTLSLQ